MTLTEGITDTEADATAIDGAARAATEEAVTEVVAPTRPGPQARPRWAARLPSRPRAAQAPRARRSRLPRPALAVAAPRDTRWWIGTALLVVSLLLVGFVAHAAVFSALQHHRAQAVAYDELRTSLAKAETPVGQLVDEETMIAPGTPVALIEAPSIGLSEVVLEGTSAETLRSGAGHRRDSVMPGQAGTSVVLGRQLAYGGPFADLNRLEPGDEITITTGQGQNTYRVFGLRRAGDPKPEPLREGEGRIELQTADGLALFPSGALYVDAQLVSEAQQTPSRVMAYAALPEAERAMGQDAGAWFTAFFVLVFFAAAAVGVCWLWTTWGRWHAWLIGVPVLLSLGVATADVVMNALPNLI